PVDRHLVFEVQLVARNPVAEVAVGRQIRIDDRWLVLPRGLLAPRHAALSAGFFGLDSSPRFLRNRFHGAIGLPCHRVDGGTSSPRMTSEAGPTVAPAPIL